MRPFTPSMSGQRALTLAAVLSPLVVFLCVYGPAVGRGFISDDFGWIVQSRVTSGRDIVALLAQNHGFYRPIVALSFAADYTIFGAHALGYGWTNLGLAMLSAGLLFFLLRSIELTRGAAWFGAALWLLNFHGINMALLWISGRTAFLLIGGALIAVIGVLRGRIVIALCGFVVALFSKEEALAIPIIWAAAYGLDLVPLRQTRSRQIGLAVGGIVVLGAYAWLRTHAGAMTPTTAPSYYRFTFAPSAVGRNVLECLIPTITHLQDRAADRDEDDQRRREASNAIRHALGYTSAAGWNQALRLAASRLAQDRPFDSPLRGSLRTGPTGRRIQRRTEPAGRVPKDPPYIAHSIISSWVWRCAGRRPGSRT